MEDNPAGAGPSRFALYSFIAVLVLILIAGSLYSLLTSSLENVKWELSVPWPWWLIAAVVCLPLLSAWLFYRRVWSELSPARWSILLALRVFATAALLLACFQPRIVFERTTYTRSSLLLMADVSKSMSISDTDEPRLDRVRTVLAPLMETLKRDFNVSLYTFAGGAAFLEPVPASLADLKAVGDSTNIPRSVRQALDEHANEPLAGVVVFTDGIHNAETDIARGWDELKTPVFPVGVGSKLQQNKNFKDVVVRRVEGPRYAIVNNEVEIAVYLRNVGFPNAVVDLKLVDAEGASLADKQFPLLADASEQKVVLSFTPTEVGKLYVDAVLPVQTSEKVAENNSQNLILSVINPKIKLLYVQGTVRPEYKWLLRALERDANIEVLSLVRLTGARFQQQGKVQDLDLAGFPQDIETLRIFDVVILSDLDASFFSAQEFDNVREIVREGKGFAMLGGDNSFGPGGYRGTPIDEILPVFSGTRQMEKVSELFDLELTAEGVAHPVFAGIADAFMTPQRTPEHPIRKLRGFVDIQGPKPTATVLAVHPQRLVAGDKLPILAVQPFGKGRTAAFTAYSTARWRERSDVYIAFWGQLVRWLAQREIEEKSAGKGVVASSDKASYEPGQRVRIFAQARGDEGAPTNHAEVTAAVTPPSGKAQDFNLIYTPPADGNYEVSFDPEESGKYAVKVAAVEAGVPVGDTTVTFNVGRPNLEYEELDLNDDVLRRIAGDSGGRYYYLSNVNELLLDLAAEQEATRITGYRKFYHLPAIFFIFIALLTAEWVLRRTWQLI